MDMVIQKKRTVSKVTNQETRTRDGSESTKRNEHLDHNLPTIILSWSPNPNDTSTSIISI